MQRQTNMRYSLIPEPFPLTTVCTPIPARQHRLPQYMQCRAISHILYFDVCNIFRTVSIAEAIVSKRHCKQSGPRSLRQRQAGLLTSVQASYSSTDSNLPVERGIALPVSLTNCVCSNSKVRRSREGAYTCAESMMSKPSTYTVLEKRRSPPFCCLPLSSLLPPRRTFVKSAMCWRCIELCTQHRRNL